MPELSARGFWETSLIRLRAVEPGDAETLYRWNQDSERARLLDFVWPPSSLASVQSWAEEQSKRKMENEAFHWIIETPEGTPVGTISTHDCCLRNGTFSYGVDIAREHRCKGYASAAILLVLRYYFDELRYHKVNVVIHVDNPSSLHLHEKLGFTREGTLRESQYTHGEYIDIALMGMTAAEFHQKYNLQSPDNVTIQPNI